MTMQSPRSRRARRRRQMFVQVIIGLGLAALLLTGLSWYSANSGRVSDQFRIWTTTASTEAMAFADETAMSDEGRFAYFASAPAIENGQAFRDECATELAGGRLLGCYDGENIHILDVFDERLAGIREVTAAHEMLHAAFARMPDSERKELDPLLEAAWAAKQADPAFVERMSVYGDLEGRSLLTELHSILGTEVAELDPALEAHYAKYFTDRSVVVGLYSKYAGVIDGVTTQAEQLAAELTTLGDSLEQQQNDYTAALDELNATITEFNTDADSGAMTVDEFTERREALVARTAELETWHTDLESQFAHYDELYAQLSEIDALAVELDRSMDGSAIPAPPS